MTSLAKQSILTLDLGFMNLPGAIAVYLIPHAQGILLIESGPASTLKNLENRLSTLGYRLSHVTDVFLTHIHLDHAGAAGWLAKHGARIHVHAIGAPHLNNPERLLASARRIYGNALEDLWGEFVPVPETQLVVHEDNEQVELYGIKLRLLDTPGHAYHHLSYIFDDICFSGDIGGVRLAGSTHIRLPMPPPELHLEIWRESLRRLIYEQSKGTFSKIAPTHFGIYNDAEEHLQSALTTLDAVEEWLEATMQDQPDVEQLNERFLAWTQQRSIKAGTPEEDLRLFEAVNPSSMSAYGLYRYWHKVRLAEQN